jgi:hypothetical protein
MITKTHHPLNKINVDAMKLACILGRVARRRSSRVERERVTSDARTGGGVNSAPNDSSSHAHIDPHTSTRGAMSPNDDARDKSNAISRARPRARRARRPPRRVVPPFSCARCGIVGVPPVRRSEFDLRGTFDAAREGNLEELKHLVDVHGSAYECAATWEAASAGRVDILAWAFCRAGPVNGFDDALEIAESEGQEAAAELLRFIKLNKYERRRVMTRAAHFASVGGERECALFEALKQIWRKLYGASEYGPEDEHFVFRDGDEDEKQSMEDNEPTLAQELATKILNAIDSEKTSLSSGTYVKLCDALREVHNLPVKRKPKSLFDGVVFGPNRLEFDEWLYEEYR